MAGGTGESIKLWVWILGPSPVGWVRYGGGPCQIWYARDVGPSEGQKSSLQPDHTKVVKSHIPCGRMTCVISNPFSSGRYLPTSVSLQMPSWSTIREAPGASCWPCLRRVETNCIFIRLGALQIYRRARNQRPVHKPRSKFEGSNSRTYS